MNNTSTSQYQAVVFKAAPPATDFTCSTQVVLPGRHTEQEAWRAVRAALAEGDYIGGEVRAAPCARQ